MWVILETAQVLQNILKIYIKAAIWLRASRMILCQFWFQTKLLLLSFYFVRQQRRKGLRHKVRTCCAEWPPHTHSSAFPCWIHGPLTKLGRKSPYFSTPRCQFAFLSLSAEYQHTEMLWSIAIEVSFLPNRLGQTTERQRLPPHWSREQHQSSERRCSRFQIGSAEVRPSSLTSLIRV